MCGGGPEKRCRVDRNREKGGRVKNTEETGDGEERIEESKQMEEREKGVERKKARERKRLLAPKKQTHYTSANAFIPGIITEPLL